MGRPSNQSERRAQIVAALIDVLGRKGWERSTTAEIAKAAGLTPGLLHHHFESREAILLAAVEELAALLRARQHRRTNTAAAGTRAELDAFIDAHLALGDDASASAARAWTIIGAEAMWHPAVRAVYQASMAESAATLTAIVKAICKSERRATAPAATVAVGILVAIEGAFRVGLVAPAALPIGSAAKTVRRLAHGAIDACALRTS